MVERYVYMTSCYVAALCIVNISQVPFCGFLSLCMTDVSIGLSLRTVFCCG